jgi:hypothetical protein
MAAPTFSIRISTSVAVVCTFVVLIGFAASTATPKFFSDDPITREPDPGDASQVQPFPIHLSWDLLSSLIGRQGDRTPHRAQNVNTVDEVPDSSWFTNRAGSLSLTDVDVARGPDTTVGPAPGRWTVVSGKSEGVRPGFTILDSRGIRWFVKFDAPGYPEQATGAEVVSTKLFWAIGYNVAETHVATICRNDLVLGDGATITLNGKRRRLTTGDIDRVLAQADRSPDGSYRALVSKALEGKPVGEFLYYGTRADDPNDIVAHENRRELRGMGLAAAWIDRVDAKAGNTLDTLVVDSGKTTVRHHVLDFGSTLGSGGTAPNEYWEGYEYLWTGAQLKKLPGLGFPVEPWRTIHYPTLRGVGRFEGDHFDPAMWKSRVPNAAYVRADADDTFWAARKVMAITDSMIAAAVKSGKYSDPAAERYLVQTLIKRRDAIGRSYLAKIDPVVNPTLAPNGALRFANVAVDSDLASGPTAYQATWWQFDNATGEATRMLDRTESREPSMQGPRSLPGDLGAFVRVDITAISTAHPPWNVPVRAYFRRTEDGWSLVGLERMLAG